MMKLLVASPLENRNYDEIEEIHVVTLEGERGILRGHIALVCALKTSSAVRLVTPTGRIRLRVGEGSFLRFRDDEGVLVTRSFSAETPT